MVSELGFGEKLAGLLALEPSRSDLSETQFTHLQKEMIRLLVNLAGYTFSKSDLLLLLLNNSKSLSRAYLKTMNRTMNTIIASHFYLPLLPFILLPLFIMFYHYGHLSGS